MGGTLLNGESSDMDVVVEGERISVPGENPENFCGRNSHVDEVKQTLTSTNSGELGLETLNRHTLLETLRSTEICGSGELQSKIVQHFRETLSIDNLFEIYEVALSGNLEQLSDLCRHFADSEASKVLQDPNFLELSKHAVIDLLNRDTFCAEEIEIFSAVERWCAYRPRDDREKAEVSALVRLLLIPMKDIDNAVKQSGLFSISCLDRIRQIKQWQVEDCNYRKRVAEGIEKATPPAMYASINHDAFIGRWKYSQEHLNLTIKLSSPSLVNHIQFRLSEPISYCMAVSTNLKRWMPIADNSMYPCHSLQTHYFEPRSVHYIRISMTNGLKKVRMTDFLVSYSLKFTKKSLGFYAPEENVATELLGASVIECDSGCENLIGLEYLSEGDDSQWISHKIGLGSITIRLPQPNLIGSIEFLLKEASSYHVDTSTDGFEWTRAADRTSGLESGWQLSTFEPRLVIFIRIKGTSPINQLFSIALFECPARLNDASERWLRYGRPKLDGPASLYRF